MKIKVLEVNDSKGRMVVKGTLNDHCNFMYYVDGEFVDEKMSRGSNIIIGCSEKLQCKSKSKSLTGYTDGSTTISREEYQSKPQSYYDDSVEADVLRAIANRRELKDYKPVYKEPEMEDVEVEVVGYINDTGSDFIVCSVGTKGYPKKGFAEYMVRGGSVAMDEYKKLSDKYSKHGSFEAPDRVYLRFVRVNGEYVFGDQWPFSDRDHLSSHLSLDDAKNEEKKIRDAVAHVVKNAIFREALSPIKAHDILTTLIEVREAGTKKAMVQVLDGLIKNLKEYIKF